MPQLGKTAYQVHDTAPNVPSGHTDRRSTGGLQSHCVRHAPCLIVLPCVVTITEGMDSPRSLREPADADDLAARSVSSGVVRTSEAREEEPDRLTEDFGAGAELESRASYVAWEKGAAELWAGLDSCSDDERLLRWFAGLVPTRVDVITHLEGSSERFLVHAESVLLRLVLDTAYGNTVFLEEPQTLRLLYSIESFLESLRQCRAKFLVVFFDCYVPLLRRISPLLCVARQLFLSLCQVSQSPLLEYRTFPDWTHDSFVAFVRSTSPPCVLLDDCTDLKAPEEEEEEEGVGLPSIVSASLACVAGCLRLHMQVALLSGLDRKGRKVYCFAVQPSRLPSLVSQAVARVENFLTSVENLPTPAKSLEDLVQVLDTVKTQLPCSQHIGIRDILIAAFLREDLTATAETASSEPGTEEEENRQLAIAFAKLLLIASQLARSVPLGNRAVASFEEWNDEDEAPVWEFTDTLNMLCCYFLVEVQPWIDAVASSDPTQARAALRQVASDPQALQRDLADLFDARWLKCLAMLAAKHLEQQEEGYVRNGVGVFKGGGCSCCRAHALDPVAFWGLPPTATSEMSTLLENIVGLPPQVADVSDVSCFVRVFPPGSLALELKSEVLEPRTPGLLPLKSSFFAKLLQRQPDAASLLPGTTVWPQPPTFNALEFYAEGGDETGLSEDGRGAWTRGLPLDVAKHEIETRHARAAKPVQTWVNLPDDPRLRRKMMLRMTQKGAATISRFASSLVGSSTFGATIRLCPPGTHAWAPYLDEEAAESDAAPEAASPPKKADVKKEKKKSAAAAATAGAEPKKISSKAEAIIKANTEAQKKKSEETDNERLPNVLSNLDAVASKSTSPVMLLGRLLDTLIGHVRSTDELGTLPGVTSFLKLPTSHRKVFTHVTTILTAAMTRQFAKVSDRDTEACQALHRLQCFAFQFCQTYYKMYKGELGVEDIQAMQKLLIAMGFVKSAAALCETWKVAKAAVLKQQEGEAAASQASAEKVKGKGKAKPGTNSKQTSQSKQKAGLTAAVKGAYVDPAAVPTCSRRVPSGLEAEVQLKFMGHLMERSLGSAPDPRVGFYPDAWQKRLLDTVDERRSALVCAPTGSGKTFACFYAMEKTLTLDNDSVIVFVCPAKALVQQVNHEIAARFRSKEYPVGSAAVLSATMLREMHDGKVLNAQILVTLPTLLEMLLLSPEYRDWVTRLKYVVLDEIHCIGEGDEEGQAWERLIQLMPCPFLALSATIGNPGSFHNWLGAAHVSADKMRKDGKPPVEVIQFNERYADLGCYVYTDSVPPPALHPAEETASDPPASSDEKPSHSALLPLNPFVCLTYHQLKTTAVPRDFYAPSADMLQMYIALEKSFAAHYPADSEKLKALEPVDRAELEAFRTMLRPSVYFQNCPAISKRQYR